MSTLAYPGLLSWLALGLLTGLTGWPLVRGRRFGRLLALLAGLLGAGAGGVLATLLGFGGLVSFDLRSVTVAGLGGLLATLGLSLAAAPRGAGDAARAGDSRPP